MDGRFSQLQGIDDVCINIYGLVVQQKVIFGIQDQRWAPAPIYRALGLLSGLDGSIDVIHNGWSLIKD